MHVGKGLSVALTGIAGFALSTAAAVISYQLYERHFLRLKRFFEYKAHSRVATKESVSIPALH
jgi:peptidoglycan/LPS O-acetylase OafA/YrhL